ncbi:uncharacterized protein LOC143178242 [Calliopsis andreniformis]|uniref:uncharacterized protein LOC143178242 n=1 Tax=Calliopsis andreniformis TaxID=337506 RepID=UPI003FCD2BE9
MLEREFAAYGVKANAVKCSTVIRNLDQSTMKLILDVIEAPPEVSTYKDIKQALIDKLEKTEEENLRQLLSVVEMGNKKTSELLREMTQLTGKNVSESALRTLWRQRLPVRIQEILAIFDDGKLDKLAKAADKVLERRGMAQMAAVSNIAHLEKDAKAPSGFQDGEVAASSRRLTRIEVQLQKRGRSCSRRRYFNRRRSKSNPPTKNSNGFCYFHNKFGTESWKCRQPCAWSGPDKRKQGN